MEQNEKLRALETLQKKLYAYNCASNSLYLDAVTVAPKNTAEGRGVALHQFGVQEAFLIEIDLDSRIEHICQIRAGTQMRQAVISTHGQHQTHIDT